MARSLGDSNSSTRTPEMKRLSFVLPLAARAKPGGDDVARACGILLPSLAKFLDPGMPVAGLVIVPAGERTAVAAALSPFSARLGLRVVSEEDLLDLFPGGNAKHRCPLRLLKRADLKFFGGRIFSALGSRAGWDTLDGWRRQQLLKLLAAQMTEDQFYLTLDADVCLTQPARLTNFFPGGKALFTPEPTASHPTWWRGSAAILGLPPGSAELDAAMGVPPAILSRQVVLDLLERLAELANADASMTIFERLASRDDWTEYSLYWLFLLERGETDRLHTALGSPALRHSEHNIWERRHAPEADAVRTRVEAAFRDARGLFIVIQSPCIPLEEGLAAFRPHLR